MELEEKVKKAQKGDDNAFYELINDRKSFLYKAAFTYMGNKEDALDIISETVYKTYISLKKLKEPCFFNTWVMRILINCCMDELRKRKKTITMDEKFEYKNEKEGLEREDSIDLRNAVKNLDEKCRAVVILKYFEGFTLKEVSDILDCPLGTVKTNLHKALKILKIELKEENCNEG